MESQSIKTQVLADIEISPDVYGDYNRSVRAYGQFGCAIGTMREVDTLGAPLGEYKGATIELHEYFSGRVLIGRIINLGEKI